MEAEVRIQLQEVRILSRYLPPRHQMEILNRTAAATLHSPLPLYAAGDLNVQLVHPRPEDLSLASAIRDFLAAHGSAVVEFEEATYRPPLGTRGNRDSSIMSRCP